MKTLPRGIHLDHGYIQIRIFNDGVPYFKNFGRDCDLARELAKIHLAEKRKEILMGKFGLTPPLPRRHFEDVAADFLRLWSEQRTPEGMLLHSPSGIKRVTFTITGVLLPSFGKYWYDVINSSHIQRWRDARIEDVLGTTANREQTILSSIFSMVEGWIEKKKLRAFRIPLKNPCKFVKKAKMRKRDRILSRYELSKLKLAFVALNDVNGWENVALLLKTCLSLADAKRLSFGDSVNLERSKTGVTVINSIVVTHRPNWDKWRSRWAAACEKADVTDAQTRDLRKSGGNLLVGLHDIKLVSLYMGHATQKTTEEFYTKRQAETLQPLANTISTIVDGL